MSCADHRQTRRGSMVTVVGEHRRKASFRNEERKKFTVVRVDQGMVTNELAADFVVSQDEIGTLIIELKGSDVRHACRQVIATLGHLGRCGFAHEKVAGLIIASRYPSTDTTVQRLQNEFLQKKGHKLKVSSSQTEFDFARLFG